MKDQTTEKDLLEEARNNLSKMLSEYSAETTRLQGQFANLLIRHFDLYAIKLPLLEVCGDFISWFTKNVGEDARRKLIDDMFKAIFPALTLQGKCKIEVFEALEKFKKSNPAQKAVIDELQAMLWKEPSISSLKQKIYAKNLNDLPGGPDLMEELLGIYTKYEASRSSKEKRGTQRSPVTVITGGASAFQKVTELPRPIGASRGSSHVVTMERLSDDELSPLSNNSVVAPLSSGVVVLAEEAIKKAQAAPSAQTATVEKEKAEQTTRPNSEQFEVEPAPKSIVVTQAELDELKARMKAKEDEIQREQVASQELNRQAYNAAVKKLDMQRTFLEDAINYKLVDARNLARPFFNEKFNSSADVMPFESKYLAEPTLENRANIAKDIVATGLTRFLMNFDFLRIRVNERKQVESLLDKALNAKQLKEEVKKNNFTKAKEIAGRFSDQLKTAVGVYEAGAVLEFQKACKGFLKHNDDASSVKINPLLIELKSLRDTYVSKKDEFDKQQEKPRIELSM